MRNRIGRDRLHRLALAALSAAAALRASAAEQICFNPLAGIPKPLGNNNFTWSGGPAIDGLIDGGTNALGDSAPPDGGWRGAFQYQFVNGTTAADGRVMVGAGASWLNDDKVYFAWTVNNAAAFQNSDAVVIAFADGNGQYRRFDVFPVCGGAGGGVGVTQQCLNGAPVCASGGGSVSKCQTGNKIGNVLPWQINYYVGTNDGAGNISWSGQIFNYPWPEVEVAVTSGTAGSSGPYNWTVEMRIPRQSQSKGYSIASQFKIYLDAFRIELTQPGGTLTELVWPTSASPVDNNIDNIPNLSEWGDATLGGGSCGGVHVTNIRSNGTTLVNGQHVPAPNVINWDRHDMQLTADVANDTACGVGPQPPCPPNPTITASFKVANFGFNGPTTAQWKPVPAASANPSAVIAPGSSTSLTTGNWDVTADPDVNNYKANPHQCMLVELSSPNTVTFSNRSSYTNMDFGPASVFAPQPVVLRGDLMKLPPGRSENQYDVHVTATPRVVENVARIEVLAHGMHRTGKTIDLERWRTSPKYCFQGCTVDVERCDERRFRPPRCVPAKPKVDTYEIVESTGSFGYGVTHQLTAEEAAVLGKLGSDKLLEAWRLDLGLVKAGFQKTDTPGIFSVAMRPEDSRRLAPQLEFAGVPPPVPPPNHCCFGKGPNTRGIVGLVVGIGVLGLVAHRPRRRREGDR
jgi:hypothetical protein